MISSQVWMRSSQVCMRSSQVWMRSSQEWMRSTQCGWDLTKCGWDLANWLERLAVNAKVATVLGSILASSDTVESEGRQMKQCRITYIKRRKKNSPFKISRRSHIQVPKKVEITVPYSAPIYSTFLVCTPLSQHQPHPHRRVYPLTLM